jgi:hypothetical protein
MTCPECQAKMTYVEGQDESYDDVLMPYAYWFCPACNATIWDWEDEFEYPPGCEERP